MITYVVLHAFIIFLDRTFVLKVSASHQYLQDLYNFVELKDVTLDEFDMSRDGIKHRNIRDFLLTEEWN